MNELGEESKKGKATLYVCVVVDRLLNGCGCNLKEYMTLLQEVDIMQQSKKALKGI